jgi:hypothetical protein
MKRQDKIVTILIIGSTLLIIMGIVATLLTGSLISY